MNILLTNDDGVHAPGLAALYDELLRLGDVTVVAPKLEQSGVGLSITYMHPIIVDEVRRDGRQWAYAAHGSPADCVKLGMLQFCDPKPDIIVSGINSGANVGINVLYSGTVAGAIEGAFYGVPSVAVSHYIKSPPDYHRAARLAVGIIRQLADRGMQPHDLWNINVPENKPGWPLGVKVASLSVRRHVDTMEKRTDPRGKPYYWSGLDPLQHHQMDEGTDVRELADGYVTVTPLDYDVSRYDVIEKIERDTFDLPEA